MAGSLMAAMATIMRRAAKARGCGFGACASVAALLLLAGCSVAPLPEAGTPVPEASLVAGALHPAALRFPEGETLVGLGVGEVLARLGEPDLRRPEPPAELWQYRSADCVLEVILYAQSGTPRVIGSEIYARSADGTPRCPSLSGAATSRQRRL